MFTAMTFAEFVMKEPDGRWSQFKESNEIHYQEHWDECPRKQSWLLPLGAGQMNWNFTGQVRIVLRCNQLSTIYGHKIASVGSEWEAQMLFRQCIVLYGGTAPSLRCTHPWVFNIAQTRRSSWMFDHPATPNTFHLWKSHGWRLS